MIRPEARLSTVTTAATSYNLIDLATLKILLGIAGGASDAYLNLLIPQASQAARTYCNNPIVVETIQDQIYPWRDDRPWTVRPRQEALQLTRWPIVSVISVVETEGASPGTPTTLVAGTDFLADTANGQLIRLDSYQRPRSWGSDPVTAQYQAGWSPVPPDVVDAVHLMVKAKFYAQSRDPMIRSESAPSVYEAQYFFATGPGGQGDLPVDAMAKLDRYRVPVIA
jgi:hypothetical protein